MSEAKVERIIEIDNHSRRLLENIVTKKALKQLTESALINYKGEKFKVFLFRNLNFSIAFYNKDDLHLIYQKSIPVKKFVIEFRNNNKNIIIEKFDANRLDLLLKKYSRTFLTKHLSDLNVTCCLENNRLKDCDSMFKKLIKYVKTDVIKSVEKVYYTVSKIDKYGEYYAYNVRLLFKLPYIYIVTRSVEYSRNDIDEFFNEDLSNLEYDYNICLG